MFSRWFHGILQSVWHQQHGYQENSFKKEANSLVIRLPLATKFQSLFIIFPVLTNIQRLLFVWSSIGLPIGGKTSIIISDKKNLWVVLFLIDILAEEYFFLLDRNGSYQQNYYLLQCQNILIVLLEVNYRLILYLKSNLFFSNITFPSGFTLDPLISQF